ncbi:MAG: Membrane protein 2, distant similarity to thiosulphate:quinone oxidoreductase DoxD, partial [uncultured Solirubrobacteraceae bacterium]
ATRTPPLPRVRRRPLHGPRGTEAPGLVRRPRARRGLRLHGVARAAARAPQRDRRGRDGDRGRRDARPGRPDAAGGRGPHRHDAHRRPDGPLLQRLLELRRRLRVQPRAHRRSPRAGGRRPRRAVRGRRPRPARHGLGLGAGRARRRRRGLGRDRPARRER